jgi:hypothetical protein
MPITYRVDLAASVVLTTATGALTDQDVLRHKQALLDDPAVRPDMAELSDVRGVSALEVTPEGIRMFTAFDRSAGEDSGRLAIVASKDFAFGTARMYQMRGPEDRVGVFRCIDEARAWLGLTTD